MVPCHSKATERESLLKILWKVLYRSDLFRNINLKIRIDALHTVNSARNRRYLKLDPAVVTRQFSYRQLTALLCTLHFGLFLLVHDYLCIRHVRSCLYLVHDGLGKIGKNGIKITLIIRQKIGSLFCPIIRMI